MRLFALAVIAGVVFPLDHLAIQQALTIANSSLESTRRQFHADYHFPVNTAPVDFISVVSPFRRIVLSAETEMRLGRRMFGQREAMAALRVDPDRLEVYAELTFPPHNPFIGVPDYTIQLDPVTSRAPAVLPQAIDRLPRSRRRIDDRQYPFPYPLQGEPGARAGSEPLLGGTLLARIPLSRLDLNAVYAVTVRDAGKVLGQARVDFARLR
jgi:hypothetical protein